MKRTITAQTITLLSGTIFAFYTVVVDFMRFYSSEGTLLKISGCAIPNPVTTPCFYGAFGFLLALYLSYKILLTIDTGTMLKKQLKLFYFLIAGTLFAWGNFLITVYTYFQSKATNVEYIGCSGLKQVNPLNTPCFVGASIFLIALFIAWGVLSKLKKLQLPIEKK
jgi:hypothetical protein